MDEIIKYLPPTFVLVGVGLLAGGLRYHRRLQATVAECRRAPATVIDNVEQSCEDGFVYHPVVEYFVGGARFTLTGRVGSSVRKGAGTKLTVMFNPANPGQAHLAEDYYFAAMVILGLGGAFVVMGSAVTYFTFR